MSVFNTFFRAFPSALKSVIAFGALGSLLIAPAALASAAQAQVCRDDSSISIHCGEAPSAWQTDDGRVWVVFVQNQTAWLSYSDERREGLDLEFSTPVKINQQPEAIEVNGENRPKIIVDRRPGQPDHIYISWTQKTAGQHTGDIRFTRSVDGGQSFESVRTVNDDGLLTSHRFDSLFLTESGHLYITWLDKRELEAASLRNQPYTGSAVFYTVSDNQGASFMANRKVADHSCECCRIAVASNGEDGMALMWRQVFDDTTRDHAITRIGPTGEVDAFARASNDDWQINACPHHGPDMARQDDNSYHLSWFSAGNLNKGIYYGRHDMTTGVTSQVHQIDGSPGAAHPQVMVWQDEVLLVWKRFDGVKTDLLLSRSNDQGKNWSAAEVLTATSNASDHPLMIMGPQGPRIGWSTRADGYLWLALPTSSELAADSADIQPFMADTLARLKAEREGSAFILALWSVDCPPCMVELDMLGKMRQQRPDLPLVLISTDNISRREDAEDFLIDYGLDDMTSWMFADSFAESLRFSIDPQWYGELPRSYHFDENHQSHAHSGILTEQQLRGWLGL